MSGQKMEETHRQARRAWKHWPHLLLFTAKISVGVSDEGPYHSCSLAYWTHPQREYPQSEIHCT